VERSDLVQSEELKAALLVVPEKPYIGDSHLIPHHNFPAGVNWTQIVWLIIG
jgi:hypothetical protein